MPQGLLPFQYEEERSGSGTTALAGLPLYLEMAEVAGVPASIRRHMLLAGSQGWDDVQVVMALILLQLAGGEAVDDLRILEADAGFATLLRELEGYGRTRRQRNGGSVRGAPGPCPRLRRCSATWTAFTTPSKSWPSKAKRPSLRRPQGC